MNFNFFLSRDESITLQRCFERMKKNATEIVLIRGNEGVGKTFFVENTINQFIGYDQNGFLVRGKCEFKHQNSDFYAIKKVFNELVFQLLMLDDARISEWVSLIKRVLGKGVFLLIDFLPDLNLLLKMEKDIEFSCVEDYMSQLAFLLIKFIACFHEKKSPVVLFFDDMQWADQETIMLLRDLMCNEDAQQTMFVITFCDNKDKLKERFLSSSLKEQGIKYEVIRLEAFSYHQTTSYINELFNYHLCEDNLISYYVFKSTGGNPFLINQIILKLKDQFVLSYSNKTEMYSLELEMLKNLGISKKVIRYFNKRIKGLPTDELVFLRTIAIMGQAFSIEDIKRILSHEYTEDEVKRLLDELMTKNILIPSQINKTHIEFINKHIHKSVIDHISEANIREINYRIGMFEFHDECHRSQRKSTCLEYLNAALPLIKDKAVLLKLAALNFEAGINAEAFYDYHSAQKYFHRANGLILEHPYDWDEAFTVVLRIHLANCNYKTNNMGCALSILNEIEEGLHDPLRIVDVLINKATLFITVGEYEEAVFVIERGLALHHIKITKGLTHEEMNNQIQVTMKLLESLQFEDLLKLPETTDEKILSIMNLLVHLSLCALHLNSMLFEMALMEMLCMLIKFGNSGYSPLIIAGYGILCKKTFHNPSLIVGLNNLALQFCKRFNVVFLNAYAYFLLGAVLPSGVSSLCQSIAYLDEAISCGIKSGNSMVVSFAVIHKMKLEYCMGKPLKDIVGIGEKYEKYAIAHNLKPLIVDIESYKHLESYFKNGDLIELQELSAEKFRLKGLELSFYLKKAVIYYLADLYYEANSMVNLGKTYIRDTANNYTLIEFNLYEGLILAKLYEQKGTMRNEELRERIFSIISQFSALPETKKTNTEGKRHLLLGAYYSLSAEFEKSIEHYKLALKALVTYKNCHYRGIAYELMGNAFEKCKKIKEAKASWKQSVAYYMKWGCFIRGNQLGLFIGNERHKDLCVNEEQSMPILEQSVRNFNFENAIQVVLEETNPEKKVVNFFELINNAFLPDQCALLAYHNNGFFLLATKENAKTKLVTEQALIKDPSQYPIKLFRVVNKRNKAMFYNAYSPGILAKDLYFENSNISNGCCFPIMSDAKGTGILYFEYYRNGEKLCQNEMKQIDLLCKQLGQSRIMDQLILKIKNDSHAHVQNQLTQKETMVLKHLMDGRINKEIAESMMVTENTVKTHMKGLFRKLEVNRRVQAVSLAKDWNFERYYKTLK